MLPGLNVLIGADTSGLEKGIKDAERELTGLQGATNRIGRGMQDFGTAAQRVGARLSVVSAGVAALGGGMFALARSTSDAGNEIDKSARSAGLSESAFQDMRFAVGQVTDLTDGEFSNAMIQMNRRIGQAVDGNEGMIKSLQDLGFTQDEIASGVVGTEEAFMALSEALQGVDSDAEAARIAGELFGERLGGRLGPALRDAGGDIDDLRQRAHDLGLVLSQETIQQSADFADKTRELSLQMTAARAAIGQALLPAALAMATAFQDKVVPAISQVAESVAGAIQWFGNLPGPVQEAAGLVAAALGVGGPIVMAVGVLSKVLGGLVLATGPIGLFIALASVAFVAWQKWGDQIKEIVENVAGYFQDNFGGILEAVTIVFDGVQSQLQNFMDLFKAIFTGDLPAVMDSLAEIFAEPFRTIIELFHSDFAEPFRDGIFETIEWVKESFNGLVNWFMGLPERFMEIGRDIISGLWEGLRSAWTDFDIMGTVRGWGESMIDGLRRPLRSNSPSMAFYDIGMDVGRGLRNGIQDSFGMVRGAVQGLGQQVTSGAWDMASGVVGAMGQMFQGSKPIAAAQALINTFQGITEALKLPFPASLAAAARVAAQGFAAVRGIQSARPGSSGGAGSGAVGAASGGGGGSGGGGAQSQAAQVATQRLRLEIVGSGPEADAAFRTLQLVQEAIDNGGRLDGLIAERVAG